MSNYLSFEATATISSASSGVRSSTANWCLPRQSLHHRRSSLKKTVGGQQRPVRPVWWQETQYRGDLQRLRGGLWFWRLQDTARGDGEERCSRGDRDRPSAPTENGVQRWNILISYLVKWGFTSTRLEVIMERQNQESFGDFFLVYVLVEWSVFYKLTSQISSSLFGKFCLFRTIGVRLFPSLTFVSLVDC